jgi:chromosomal replication initiator protein
MGFIEKLQSLFGKKKAKPKKPVVVDRSREKFLEERRRKLETVQTAEVAVPVKMKKKKMKEKKVDKNKMQALVKRQKELQASEAALRKQIVAVSKLEKEMSNQELLDKTMADSTDQELERLIPQADVAMIKREKDLNNREKELEKIAAELERRVHELERKETMIREEEEGSIGILAGPLSNTTFDNFIVGPNNKFAHDAAFEVAKAPADAYNPLFLYSNVGLGKTHLMNAIGNYVLSHNKNARVAYIASEEFINDMINAVEHNALDEFRNKYRALDVLLIDDIQFIGDKRSTQEEFFHTFNSLYNAHKQIVISSDRPPRDLLTLEERLRSRFEGGLIVDIKPLSLITRTQILKNIAANNGVHVPDEVITYIAKKIKTNVRALKGSLNKVIATSSLADRELNVKLVDEVLGDVVQDQLSLDDVLK